MSSSRDRSDVMADRWKQAEEALRVSGERLRRASRTGWIGFLEWNIDRGHACISHESFELYRLSHDSPATYEAWLESVHTDDREMA